MDTRELMRYVGDASQLFGVRDYRLIGSKADGMRAVDLFTSKGLTLTVLPDRGMDIARLNYRGVNLSFMSPVGPAGPAYFCEDGSRGFMRNFSAGFLTTCGLTYMGAACNDEGEALGLHGVISNTPAYEVRPCVEAGRRLSVSGKVKEARLFGDKLVLERTVSCDSDGAGFKIHDTVENTGYGVSPLMILYHFNFGYPMLDKGSRPVLPSGNITPRDDEAAKGLPEWREIPAPTDNYREQVFFHDMTGDKNGDVTVGLINERLELFVAITYRLSQLPRFTHWKSMCAGEYALGLEPGNCHVLGRDRARADGSLQYIRPGEIKQYDIDVGIYQGAGEIGPALGKYSCT